MSEILIRRGLEYSAVTFEPEDLYARSVRLFGQAAAGQGLPSADGLDGVASLAVADAVAEAARTGMRTAVNYGGLL